MAHWRFCYYFGYFSYYLLLFWVPFCYYFVTILLLFWVLFLTISGTLPWRYDWGHDYEVGRLCSQDKKNISRTVIGGKNEVSLNNRTVERRDNGRKVVNQKRRKSCDEFWLKKKIGVRRVSSVKRGWVAMQCGVAESRWNGVGGSGREEEGTSWLRHGADYSVNY